MESLRNSHFFQFSLSVAIIALSCTVEIASAEILQCNQILAPHPYLPTISTNSNLSGHVLTKNVAAFLNLIEVFLEEVGKGDTDSFESQLRFLNIVIQGESLVQILEAYPSENNHFLILLRNSKTLKTLASSVNREEWKQIQRSAIEKLRELQTLTNQHEARATEGESDFIDIPDSNGRVRLHHLLKIRDYEKALPLLKNPKTTTRYVNTRDKNGKSPLDFFEHPFLVSSVHKSSSAIEELAKTSMPWISQMAIEVAKILYEKSAKDGEGLTILDMSFLSDPLPNPNEEINYQDLNSTMGNHKAQDNLTRFFELGGNLDAVSETGERLATLFVKVGRLDRLKKLKSLGGNFEFRDAMERNLIHRAAAFGTFQVIPFLVENGIDINAIDKSGESPIFHLGDKNVPETVWMLAHLGANLDLRNINGTTPAFHFSELNQPDHLQALVANGANLEIKNKFGGTPLWVARCDNPILLTIFAHYFISKGIEPKSQRLYRDNSNPPLYFKWEIRKDD